MLKIAHISDLHFSNVNFKLSVFFSKKIVGILNLIFNRKNTYTHEHLKDFPKLMKDMNLDHIFVSGDLTSISDKKEFELAKSFLKKFDEKIKLTIVPGNHDQYTKKAYKNDYFYKHLAHDKLSLKKLQKDKIEVKELSKKWVSISLDTCIPTHYFACSGLFSKELEKKLIKALKDIPKDKNVILINHFPIYHIAQNRKILKRRQNLIDIIKKHPQIKLFLHGHTHNYSIDNHGSFYSMSSGCISYKRQATFNILKLKDNTCMVIKYKWKNNNWEISKTFNLDF